MQALGNLFSWLVTALFGVITLLLVYESWALLTDHAPITTFIRPAVHSYPGIAFVAAVVIGAWSVIRCEVQFRGDPFANRHRLLVHRLLVDGRGVDRTPPGP
jgi:hypothetical protein